MCLEVMASSIHEVVSGRIKFKFEIACHAFGGYGIHEVVRGRIKFKFEIAMKNQHIYQQPVVIHSVIYSFSIQSEILSLLEIFEL